MNNSDNRLEAIFKCIVESYVDTAIPVGSRIVSKQYKEGLSPASIRNVMADLEEMGLICQPHTSSGRVPTSQGYRFYVDHFLNQEGLEYQDDDDLHWRADLKKAKDVEDVAEQASRILADITHNAGLFFLRNIRRVSSIRDNRPLNIQDLMHEVVNKLYIEGTRHIVDQPEFHDRRRAYDMLKAFEINESLKRFFEEEPADELVHIYIGEEAECGMPDNVSIVAKQCVIDGASVASLAVVGPIRMDYDKAVCAVSNLSDIVNEMLSDC